MRHGSLCLFTQTPYTRIIGDVASGSRALDLDALEEGTDHLPSPGGVTRMVRALVSEWERTDRVKHVSWISLASSPAPSLRLTDRTTIHHVTLDETEQSEYAEAKGTFWSALHDLATNVDLAEVDQGLTYLARAMAARAIMEHERAPFDAFYVHDFQAMRLARFLPKGIPVAFHWHGPAPSMEPEVEAYLASCLNEFDTIVVHTHGYARELRRMGVTVPVHVAYPYVPNPPPVAVTRAELAQFEATHGFSSEDVAFSLVARLDPIKSQDVAIRALAHVVGAEPRARLLIVGGGGFSAGRAGLGMGHAAQWRDELERLARELGVAHRVTFTGGILDKDLEIAYARSRAVLLPSRVEGFGLTSVEAWQRGIPIIVSSGAGVAELVRNGENGFVFAPGDAQALAKAMTRLSLDAREALKLGRAGQATAATCAVDRGARDIWGVLERLVGSRRPILRAALRPLGDRMITLVTDLDRTLTGPDLKLDERARHMLRELRQAGVRVIVATGRPLVHVVQLGLRELTDAMVVENGAIVMDSRTRETHIHGAAFQQQAERALGELGPKFSWHRVIGSGPREFADEARSRLGAAGIEHQMEYNAEHVMILPAGVDKGSGALAALALLGLRARDVWAIGDGENDVSLFRIACESAAPANASPRVASQATMMLDASYSEGFVEFARRLLREPKLLLERGWIA